MTTATMIARNSHCRFQMGAVIYMGPRLISTGINILKTHTDHPRRYGKHVISIHAEHRAILLAQSNVIGATLYVARYGGETSMPCEHCRAYMIEAGIREIVYCLRGNIIKERL